MEKDTVVSLTGEEVKRLMALLGEIPSRHMNILNQIIQVLQGAEQRTKSDQAAG
jgi:hypothetical protein